MCLSCHDDVFSSDGLIDLTPESLFLDSSSLKRLFPESFADSIVHFVRFSFCKNEIALLCSINLVMFMHDCNRFEKGATRGVTVNICAFLACHQC